MTERVLPYDRSIVGQETGYWCGPASIQNVLSGHGIFVPEREIARQTEELEGNYGWDDRDGTDHISQIQIVLNRYLPDAKYAVTEIRNDPPTRAQKDKLWADIVYSIDSGYGVVMNWVVPAGNRPRGVKGSPNPSYGARTTYHYVACMGYDDVARAVWIVDSGFWPYAYWIGFDQAASLIPPKGYAYATGGSSKVWQRIYNELMGVVN